MSGKHEKNSLASDIATVLSTNNYSRYVMHALVLGGLALACLQPATASALSINDLQVESSIGQPLSGTTTARVNSNDIINSKCVTAVASSVGGAGSTKALKVDVAPQASKGAVQIHVTSTQPMYEPMYEIKLQVNCSGSMQLSRTYMVMLNLPMATTLDKPALPASNNQSSKAQNFGQVTSNSRSRATTEVRQSQPDIQASDVAARSNTGAKTAPATEFTAVDSRPYKERFTAPTSQVLPGTEYRVQSGDSLSAIAQRLQGRPVGSTSEVANKIQQFNDHAFINSDPNLIQVGSVLVIPELDELMAKNVAPAETSGKTATSTTETNPAPTIEPSELALTPAPAVELEDAPEKVNFVDAGTADVATLAEESTVDIDATNEIDAATETFGEIIVDTSAFNDEPAALVTEPIKLDLLNEPETLVTEPVKLGLQDEPETLVTEPGELGLQDKPETLVTEPGELGLQDKPETLVTEPGELGLQDKPEALVPVAEATATSNSSFFGTTLWVLLGVILAAALLGRRFLTGFGKTEDADAKKIKSLVEHHEEPEAAVAVEAEETAVEDDTNSSPATDITPEATDTDLVQAEPEPKPAAVDYDLQELTADAASNPFDTNDDAAIDINISDNITTDIGINIDDAESGSVDFDLTQALISEAPLAADLDSEAETPLETTKRFTGPDFSATGDITPGDLLDVDTDMDNSVTMRKIFSQDIAELQAKEHDNGIENDLNVPTEQPAPDQDLDTSESFSSSTADLQTLASHAETTENPDDSMTMRLTSVLGTLEQDYEDELTASQIIKQEDIDKALASPCEESE
jgi:LysM repeat protein